MDYRGNLVDAPGNLGNSAGLIPDRMDHEAHFVRHISGKDAGFVQGVGYIAYGLAAFGDRCNRAFNELLGGLV